MQMDEEDLYSAVGRHPGGGPASSGPKAAEEADAANDATFGGAGHGNAHRSSEAGPARTAWTGAGTSVAVVAGPNRYHAQESLHGIVSYMMACSTLYGKVDSMPQQKGYLYTYWHDCTLRDQLKELRCYFKHALWVCCKGMLYLGQSRFSHWTWWEIVRDLQHC